MKSFQQYDMQTQGVQTGADGSPNTRALGRHLIILENRFNELATDVNLMQDRLTKILAALDKLADKGGAAEKSAREATLRRLLG
ncbi:hypothetical protein IY145_18570 [Methylosinus sp. H3A]|uniref:hypothetical protein n=1 Tax=Methylosinus sp. H3A TaxID=2785786 RepID=UPI0018C2FB6D|nr:hypothetical protein [Methylosinus sp. H3A]MBG0811357.1 hypothetical protein [Methylosinus sp. H3A]